MKELHKTSLYQSPYWLLVLLVVTVFAAETSIMFLLSFLDLPLRYESILDSLFLIVTIFPALYFLVLCSSRRHIAKIIQSEDLLRQGAVEIKKAHNKAVIAEEFFESVVTHVQELFYVMNGTLAVTYLSPNCKELYGYSADEFYSDPELRVKVVLADDRGIIDNMLKNIKSGEKYVVEYRITDKEGKIKWVFDRGTPHLDSEGKLKILYGSVIDIGEKKKTEKIIKEINENLLRKTALLETVNKELKETQYASINIMEDLDRKRQNLVATLKEKEVLLKEIHHRVKNNLQMMISLLRLQARAVKDDYSTGVLKDIQNRIAVMSLIHEKLYRSKDMARIGFRDYIKDLTDGLFRAYGVSGGRISLRTDVVAIECSIEKAIPVGLIINELVTNSIKYAFPGGRNGEIGITIRTVSESGIELSVADNGVGIPKEVDVRNTKTLGMQIVTSLAEQQLRGNLEINRESGTEFRITFPS